MSQADIATVDAIVRWVTSLAGAFVLPLLIVIVVLYLTLANGAPERIRRLMQPFDSVKVFGQELTFKNADPVTRSAEDTFRGYRDDTRDKYNALVEKYRIDDLHRALIARHLAGASKAERFRSTIHVADILFAESYYQLLPYWPLGGGAARSWSVRYGLVGKTWRHGTSTGEGDLTMSEAQLIDEWGMTREEARIAMSKASARSFIAVVLRDGMGRAVGILYADALTPHAFGATEAEWMTLANTIEKDSTALIAALASMVADLPRLPIIPMLGKLPEGVPGSMARRRHTDPA